MTQPSKQPNIEQKPRREDPSQDPDAAEEPTQVGDDRRMQMHLSEEPTAKSILSTHLGITIRWWAAPPRYPPVATGGAAADPGAGGAARCLEATDLAAGAVPVWGGEVAC